jgi:hypothetical protein
LFEGCLFVCLMGLCTLERTHDVGWAVVDTHL